ncbi:hypothetical protein [Halomarina rubra]|uniref:DUF7979 domain-containing protein n=1 Tax=Halomarina rubra TaxID=2071873 RepID=A0ABD6AY84_9EURY|nr:hypothetical protein [Halomarina rubra]
MALPRLRASVLAVLLVLLVSIAGCTLPSTGGSTQSPTQTPLDTTTPPTTTASAPDAVRTHCPYTLDTTAVADDGISPRATQYNYSNLSGSRQTEFKTAVEDGGVVLSHSVPDIWADDVVVWYQGEAYSVVFVGC